MYKAISSFFQAHLRAFIYELDPIEDEPLSPDGERENSPKGTKLINLHYCLAFILTNAILIETLPVLLESNFNYQSPLLFHHKIYFKDFWKYSDVIYSCAMALIFHAYARLTFNWKMGEKYRMRVDPGTGTIVANQTKWNRTLSRRILAFHRKTRHLLEWTLLLEFVCIFPYWAMALHSNWTNTVRDGLIALILPFFAIYAVWAVLNISFYFLLIVNCIHLQQLFLRQKVEKLLIKMCHHQRKTSGQQYWRRFQKNNQQVLIFFDHLRGYNAFWSPFISLFFLLHTWIFVYMLYGLLLNTGNFNVVERSFFAFFSIEIFLLLSFITKECSKVVQNNVAIYKANVAFSYQFQRRHNPPVLNLIQMSKLISNYKGTRNGFLLINQQIIDSKMFQILIFYICRLFFKRFN